MMKKHFWSEVAFKRLFDESGQLIFNFLCYRGITKEEAEDMVQEVFVRFWKNRNKVTPERALAYLYQIARNLLIDFKRHQTVKDAFEVQFKPLTASVTPSDILQAQDFKNTYIAGLGSMPEANRIVFLLNRVDGYTYKKIAESLELSEKTIEKRMSNALSYLRNYLKERGFLL